jgi:hypothetical protein
MTSKITVFKDSDTNQNLLNELGNNEYVLKNKIYFKINQKAWCNGEIMKEWNKLIWRSYLDKLGDCIPNLLILDKVTMHLNFNVINAIEKYDTEIKFIPSGMTRIFTTS